MLKLKYLQREGGHSFFFGDYWDSNETIPTGFALIADFTENPPINFFYLEKKTGLKRGEDLGVLYGGYWDPNEHILTGFALILIFAQKNFRCLQYW